MCSNSLKVVYHGNCFDGVVSSAIFTAFYRACVDSNVQLEYVGMGHSRGDPYGEDHDAFFSADNNVVLDFRYSPSERLNWWCDHHQSAFLKPADAEHFAADHSGKKCFDSKAPSCAGLLGLWLAREHGFDAACFEDHIRWADLIDSARFESPRQAVELAEPALQLMALLESGPPVTVINGIIERLSRGTIAQAHQIDDVQQLLKPVLSTQKKAIEILRERITFSDGVVSADLSDTDIAAPNKFIPYYLFDNVKYTVIVTKTASRSKISVGSNPWHRPNPLTNLAELCTPYGGGGHAVVAGISFAPSEIVRAQQAADEIATTLRRSSAELR